MRTQRAFLLLTAWLLLLAPGRALPGSKDANSEKRPIELQDILDWKSIRQPVLSDDGKWFAYRLAPVEGDGQVIVRSVEGDQEYSFDSGQAPSMRRRFGDFSARSTTLAFSPDSNWLAFTIYPTAEEAKKNRPGRRGSSDSDDDEGGPPARRPGRLYNKAALVNLSDGEKSEFEKVRSFSFSGEMPGWIALHKYAGENQGRGKEGWKGSDLLLHQLDKGTAQNIGNVAHYAFNKSGDWLAWTVDAQGKDGNGVQLRNMTSGAVQVLDSGPASFESLNWTKEGDGLAALKGVDDEDYEDPLYSLVGFKGFDQDSPSKAEFDPSQQEGFPEGMTISPNQRPAWSEDLESILFGIHQVEKKEKEEKKEEAKQGEEKAEPGDKSIQARPVRGGKPQPGERAGGAGRGKKEDPEKPDLVIWHWLDDRMQSEQQVRESRDKNFSYLCVYHVDGDRFVRLADDSLREVDSTPQQRWAVGIDRSPYQRVGTLDGRRYSDLYALDMDSGQRRLAVEKARWSFGLSPDGSRLLFYEDGHFHAYEMESGKRINLTQDVPASFVDTEDDHNVDRPPVRPRGWTSDGAYVLLSDNWDIWKVPVGKEKAVNLTVNGKKDSIRYQRRYPLDPDEEGTDLSKPTYWRAYGEWTKKGGIARIVDGRPGAQMLLWDDATFPSLIKAREADTFVLSRGTFADYPDFHSADQDLQPVCRLTDANPQQDDYLWSAGSRLIDYTGDKGDRLQAALHLPANYEEGKRYPTIVYIYERLSQRLNNYSTPSANGFNKSVYTSHGYAVLEPDIAYQVNDPGMSSVWCVLPALKAAIEGGVVDPDKVGLHGHSWGGYQTSFLITQSQAFSAAVAGAPLTNMISMYSSIYWNTGSANQPIFESSQGRFTGGYLDVPEAYARNSPVYFADQVETPLIILHNDKDGAVDWNQGIEYFNTLRRLEKPVVMLQYKGENHGLRKPENRKDYTLRMKAFFDHYLKGAPAPQWLQEGIPHLELEEHLEDRAKVIEKKKGE